MSDIREMSDVEWHKSSFSGGQGGQCVEVADLPSGKLVRDSKRPDGSVLRFTAGAWSSFVTEIRGGGFDA